MMKFFKLLPVFTFFAVAVYAQSPQVPQKMQIGGITLVIKDDARKEIQKDVDALTQSPRYFNIKVERAKTYFPIIEKVFKEERVPDEIKYLVLQESALIADAVSVSDAVGFWQFKDFTAMEMGLRVDEQIDERMNIASSSRAAAGYLKKNNYYFNNWIYAVQAYQMGAGGARKVVDEKYFGAKNMEINSKTYWYVKKYLAHVVAFQDAIKGKPQVEIATLSFNENKNISQLAKELKIEEQELRDFNKWVRMENIPGDRSYTLVLPHGKYDFDKASSIASASGQVAKASPKPANVHATESKNTASAETFIYNGLPAVRGLANESMAVLASRAGIELSKFLKYNDLTITSKVVDDQVYYLKAKRRYGQDAYHLVSGQDKLWQISQDHAIKLNRLKKLNQVYQDNALKEGMTLWLTASKDKPNRKPAPDEVVQLQDETFNWALSPGEAQTSISNRPLEMKQEDKPNNVGHNEEKQQIEYGNLQQETTHVQPTRGSEQTMVKSDRNQNDHLVRQGETLFSISKLYNTSIQQLMDWNKLDEKANIQPGQVLIISPEEISGTAKNLDASENRAVIYHEVKGSDTLYSIARNYEVTIKDLMEWNSKKDFGLTIGEKLKIHKP